MERAEAIEKLRQIVGKDLVPLADQYEITIWKSEGKKNKGWAGHVIEHYLGLPRNSAQSPNFGSWELKVIPLKRTSIGLAVKETMAITMIDPYNVAHHPFEKSHLLDKLKKLVVVARVFESVQEERSLLYSVGQFDLSESAIYEAVKQDYEVARNTIIASGPSALSGRLGTLVQPRTKGPGHGSTSRAFYARTKFVAHIIGLKKLNLKDGS
jgi:DNA mismatch repair protein MutH